MAIVEQPPAQPFDFFGIGTVSDPQVGCSGHSPVTYREVRVPEIGDHGGEDLLYRVGAVHRPEIDVLFGEGEHQVPDVGEDRFHGRTPFRQAGGQSPEGADFESLIVGENTGALGERFHKGLHEGVLRIARGVGKESLMAYVGAGAILDMERKLERDLLVGTGPVEERDGGLVGCLEVEEAERIPEAVQKLSNLRNVDVVFLPQKAIDLQFLSPTEFLLRDVLEANDAAPVEAKGIWLAAIAQREDRLLRNVSPAVRLEVAGVGGAAMRADVVSWLISSQHRLLPCHLIGYLLLSVEDFSGEIEAGEELENIDVTLASVFFVDVEEASSG